jgi:integrase
MSAISRQPSRLSQTSSPVLEKMPKKRRHDRGNPQPTLRPDGRWAIYLEMPRTSGPTPGSSRRHRYTVYGSTADEALFNADRLRDNLRAGGPLPDRNSKFEAILRAWLAAKDQEELAYSHMAGLRQHLEHHIAPYLGETPVSRLDSRNGEAEIRRWEAALRSPDRTITYPDGKGVRRTRTVGPMSRSMQRKVHITLGAVFDWALKKQLMLIDPMATVPLPKRGARPKGPNLRDAHVDAIRDAIAHHRLRTLFRLAIFVGPRAGELTGLTRACINFEDHSIDIEHGLTWRTGHRGVPELRETAKTPAGNRTIPLPDELWADLIDHLARTDAEAAARGWTPELNLVFVRGTGRPLRMDGNGGVGDLYKRCLGRAGVVAPEHHFHDLRKVASTTLTRYNPDSATPEVVKLMGHADRSVTTDTYTFAQQDRARELLDRVAEGYAERDRKRIRQSVRQSEMPTDDEKA